MTTKNQLIPYRFPEDFPRSKRHSAAVEGATFPVLHVAGKDILSFAAGGPVQLAIRHLASSPHHAVVRPLSRGREFRLSGDTLFLEVDGPGHWVIEFDEDWQNALFLFIDPLEATEPPTVPGPLRRFAAGVWHRPEPVVLQAGESLWIEPGAILEAPVTVLRSSGSVIQGPGILLGSFQDPEGVRGVLEGLSRPTLQLAASQDLSVRHLAVFDGRSWNSVCIDCENLRIENLKSVSWAVCGDGLDLVGCRDVRIGNSFIFSRDDCVSIKACDYRPFFEVDGRRNVADILVERSIFLNGDCGSALEIGFETHCESIRKVVFRDCDIVRSLPEGNLSGAALSVHAGNEAVIRDVRFEDLRIEQALDKFLDFAIFDSPYSHSDRIGGIENVSVERIDFFGSLLPRSFILGYDAEHPIRNVSIRDIRFKGARHRAILNTDHGIPTQTPPHPDLDATGAMRALSVVRDAEVNVVV